MKVSNNEFDINPLYSFSLPGYTWQCGWKYIDIELEALQDRDMILLLENNIRGGTGSVMVDSYVLSHNTKNIVYVDADNLYGQFLSQLLPYDEMKFDGNIILEAILNTPDDSGTDYCVEVDLKQQDETKEKTKNFPFCPENKISQKDKFNKHMKKVESDKYTECKKLICDWTDKKKNLIHYRMLKFNIKHGMGFDKVQEIISFQQSNCLKKNFP